MARESAYELTDAEKRDITKLIEQGKPLPEKYRFILFDDKREVELVWNGKTREVCTAILPFQTLEHVDEPRKEQRNDEELGLDLGGRQIKGWTNKLIWGDNKLILSSLKSGALRRQIEEAGGLKLIYIDPPFDVGADFSMDIEIGGETFHKEPNILEQIAYRDTWGRGADSFIAMIYERLILMRDLMHSEGSIYVHCDYRVSSHIRQVLDEVFGVNRFQSEIIWQQTRAKSTGFNSFGLEHNAIFTFNKSEKYIWNLQFKDYDEDKFDRYYCYFEQKDGAFIKYTKSEMKEFRRRNKYPQGRQFALIPLQRSMEGERPNLTYEFRGFTETWAMSKDKMLAIEKQGLVVQTSPSAIPQKKQYLEDMEGVKVGTIWDDINPVNSQAVEKVDYPTQKPEALLERILKASSNEGDLVADFFCGSGTTAAVAEKLGRKWIATDLGKFGVHTTRKRLIQVQRELKASGKPFRAFEVLNLGKYERQAYLNVSPRLSAKNKAEAIAKKEREFRELILKAYRAEPLSDAGFFHGKNAGRLVVIGPINLPVSRLFIEEVITECRRRGASRVDVLAFEFEMGLFPAVLEEAKRKGIDIAPKTIPPEVFDRRAVEKGQVRFHDIAYLEVTPRYDKKDKLTLSVELTDFSVYYSQGIADAIAAEMKAGKSEVVCHNGDLIKISKDKNGIESREVLTKKWTDWVDYWAVDFHYESRKEIIKIPIRMGVVGEIPGLVTADSGEFIDFEERWTGAYIFENEWQSFRTRQNRELELRSARHTYDVPGRYIVAVKVIDIFGNDTTSLVPVTVG